MREWCLDFLLERVSYDTFSKERDTAEEPNYSVGFLALRNRRRSKERTARVCDSLKV